MSLRRPFELRLFDWGAMQERIQIWTVVGAYSQVRSGDIKLVIESASASATLWEATISAEFPNALEMRRIRKDIKDGWLNGQRNDSFEVAGTLYHKLNHLYWDKEFPEGCQYSLLGLLRYEAWRKSNPREAWVLDQLPDGSQRHDYTRYVFEGNDTWKALWHVADAVEWAKRFDLNLTPFLAWERWRSQ